MSDEEDRENVVILDIAWLGHLIEVAQSTDKMLNDLIDGKPIAKAVRWITHHFEEMEANECEELHDLLTDQFWDNNFASVEMKDGKLYLTLKPDEERK